MGHLEQKKKGKAWNFRRKKKIGPNGWDFLRDAGKKRAEQWNETRG